MSRKRDCGEAFDFPEPVPASWHTAIGFAGMLILTYLFGKPSIMLIA